MKLQELVHIIEPGENVGIVDTTGRELSDMRTAKTLQESRRYERLRECNVICISAGYAPGWGEYFEIVIDFTEG